MTGPAGSSCGASPSPTPLRVLVVGVSADPDVCDTYRTRMHVPGLAAAGIDVQYAHAALNLEATQDPRILERQVGEAADYLWERAVAADVVVFRRGYLTHHLCFECGWAGLDIGEGAAHATSTGHLVHVGREAGVRPLFNRMERDPNIAERVAIVYETDDDLLQIPASNGAERWFRHEKDLMARMVRRADLVTTSTPVLAGRLGRIGGEPRVVRNAVDPAWFVPEADTVSASGEVRALYYGGLGRLEEYVPCAAAMHEQRRAGRVHRVWLGAPSTDDIPRTIARHFEEVHPYIVGVSAFARTLVGLHADVGVAPLANHRFNEAKSELHWLEYTMAGAVTVATRLPRSGPYDVIRHGVDGFLARRPDEWTRVLGRLAGSRDLRAEVVGRARERVLAEYALGVRTAEWALAYRDAVDRAGAGLARVDVALPNHTAGRQSQKAASTSKTASRAPDSIQAEPAAPSPQAFMEAYVAAQAFAGRDPMRLRLGLSGTAAGHGRLDANDDGWVTIDTDGSPDLRHHVGYGLPFGDASVDAVEIHRVFDALAGLTTVLITEVARVLRPGGRCTMVTLDRDVEVARQRQLMAEGVFVRGKAARLPLLNTSALEAVLAQSGFSEVGIRAQGPFLVATATR